MKQHTPSQNIEQNVHQENLEKQIIEQMDADANTTVMKLTRIVAVLGCLALSGVEFFNNYDLDWIRHALMPNLSIIIASSLPFLLRRYKVNERIITHAIAIIYLLAISFVQYGYSDVAGLTAWAVILILVIVSMCYYSNSVVMVYSFIGGIGWLLYFTFRHPALSTYLDMTDHIGRLSIFTIVFGMALWVNRRLKQEVLENRRKMHLIQKYTEELEAKNMTLSKLDQMKDEFLANTTHELRTPLHGIIGLIEPLTTECSSLDPEQVDDLNLAVQSARRLSNLVGDILDFSKLKNHETSLSKHPTDLRILTSTVFRTFAAQARQKELQLVNHIPEGFPSLNLDENRFMQVLYNLIGNAMKFTNSGTIEVGAYQDEVNCSVYIADSGIGIPLEKQNLIFNAFEQADASISREYGGTGLGLAITKSLVELHGGTIRLSSTPGQGSTFTLVFPLDIVIKPSADFSMTADAEPQAHPNSPSDLLVNPRDPLSMTFKQNEPTASGSHIGKHNKHILVVDDEPVNVRILQNLLSKEGYTVTPAFSGKEALSLLNRGLGFDLILLDVMMPQMSGYDVCRAIRDNHALTRLPILLVTAKDRSLDLVQGFEAGANDYLKKPFDTLELLARIRPLLILGELADLELQSELAHLQAQIKPHFLHNTLSAIISFVRSNPTMAREMLLELSNYLRESLSFTGSNEIMPLNRELSMIRSYLFIEQARFSDQLDVRFEIDEAIECDIPHLILQPLVENAIRHGVLPSPTGGTVTIRIWQTTQQENAMVMLQVADDGVGFDTTVEAPISEGNGIAMNNVKKRMQTLFGGGFHLESTPGHGTTITLQIPIAKETLHDTRSIG